MGYDVDFPRAFAKSQAGAYGGLPGEGTLFVSVADRDKRAVILPVARLAELGFTILATTGTAQVLRRNGIPATGVRKVSEGRGAHGEQTIVELIESGAIDMVVNTPRGQGARADGYSIRAATTSAERPIITTVQELQAAVQALEAQLRGPFGVRSLQEHDAERVSRLRRAVEGAATQRARA
jgi:carbamoyl-phosphate synthase large chain